MLLKMQQTGFSMGVCFFFLHVSMIDVIFKTLLKQIKVPFANGCKDIQG